MDIEGRGKSSYDVEHAPASTPLRPQTSEEKAAAATRVADDLERRAEFMHDDVGAVRSAAAVGDLAGWVDAAQDARNGLGHLRQLVSLASGAMRDAADPQIRTRLENAPKLLADAESLVGGLPEMPPLDAPIVRCADAVAAVLPADRALGWREQRALSDVVAAQATHSDLIALRSILEGKVQHPLTSRFQQFSPSTRKLLVRILSDRDLAARAEARQAAQRQARRTKVRANGPTTTAPPASMAPPPVVSTGDHMPTGGSSSGPVDDGEPARARPVGAASVTGVVGAKQPVVAAPADTVPLAPAHGEPAREAGFAPLGAQAHPDPKRSANIESYEDMLAAVLAARDITNGADPDDADANARVKKLLEPVAKRLDELNDHQGQLARFGAGNIAGQTALDISEAAIRSWLQRIALGARVNSDELVTKFRVGAEPIRFLTGERGDAPTLRAFDHASRLTGIGAGAALLAPALVPIAAEETALLAFVGRVTAQRVALWALTNPATALAASEALLGFGVQVGEDGWESFWGQLQDPQGRWFVVAQVLMDFMHVKTSMSSHPDASKMLQPSRTRAAFGDRPADLDTARQQVAKVRAVVQRIHDAATSAAETDSALLQRPPVAPANDQAGPGLVLREPSVREAPGGTSRGPRVGKPYAENPLGHVEQREDNWCGAACGEMAARRLGVDVDQSALAATPHFEPKVQVGGQAVLEGGFQTEKLTAALDEVAKVPGRRWVGGGIPHDLSTPQELLTHLRGYLSATKASIILRVSGGDHWIIVDDVLPNGRIVCRDPSEQTSTILTAQQLSAMQPTGDAVLSFPEKR